VEFRTSTDHKSIEQGMKKRRGINLRVREYPILIMRGKLPLCRYRRISNGKLVELHQIGKATTSDFQLQRTRGLHWNIVKFIGKEVIFS